MAHVAEFPSGEIESIQKIRLGLAADGFGEEVAPHIRSTISYGSLLHLEPEEGGG